MAQTFQLDINSLEVGEVEDMAAYVGMGTGEFMKFMADLESLPAAERIYAMPKGMLTAMIWLSGRRQDPNFTIEDAKRVRVTELEYAPTKPAKGRSKNPPGQQPLAQRPKPTRARAKAS